MSKSCDSFVDCFGALTIVLNHLPPSSLSLGSPLSSVFCPSHCLLGSLHWLLPFHCPLFTVSSVLSISPVPCLLCPLCFPCPNLSCILCVLSSVFPLSAFLSILSALSYFFTYLATYSAFYLLFLLISFIYSNIYLVSLLSFFSYLYLSNLCLPLPSLPSCLLFHLFILLTWALLDT